MRTLIRIVAVLVIIGGGGAFYVWHFMWNKKAPDASTGKAIVFTAADLAKEYSRQDEKLADSKYLDKKIEVNGIVSEIDKDQDGGVLVILQTSDPSAGVQCAMEDKGTNVNKGQNITIRGICTGSGITGISLKGCKIKQ